MSDRASAERACKEQNPIIDGRKANVNLAILGAKPRGNVQAGKSVYGLRCVCLLERKHACWADQVDGIGVFCYAEQGWTRLRSERGRVYNGNKLNAQYYIYVASIFSNYK